MRERFDAEHGIDAVFLPFHRGAEFLEMLEYVCTGGDLRTPLHFEQVLDEFFAGLRDRRKLGAVEDAVATNESIALERRLFLRVQTQCGTHERRPRW